MPEKSTYKYEDKVFNFFYERSKLIDAVKNQDLDEIERLVKDGIEPNIIINVRIDGKKLSEVLDEWKEKIQKNIEKSVESLNDYTTKKKTSGFDEIIKSGISGIEAMKESIKKIEEIKEIIKEKSLPKIREN